MLLHSAKYLLTTGQPEKCFSLLQVAINIGLLFKASAILIQVYKVLGEYYSSRRDHQMAQFAYTKALSHSLEVGDLKATLLMYDVIGRPR